MFSRIAWLALSWDRREKSAIAPRLLVQTGDAKAAIDRAFDSVQDREANKKQSDLDEMIRVAQAKMAATRKKLDELQRQSATSEVTLSLSLREDMAKTVLSMSSVWPWGLVLLACERRRDWGGGAARGRPDQRLAVGNKGFVS